VTQNHYLQNYNWGKKQVFFVGGKTPNLAFLFLHGKSWLFVCLWNHRPLIGSSLFLAN